MEQALADYAVMITELKKDLGAQTCPVIVFGGRWGLSELYIYPSSPDRHTHIHINIHIPTGYIIFHSVHMLFQQRVNGLPALTLALGIYGNEK